MRPALLAAALTLTTAPAWAQDVSVFAAASLKNALDEVAAQFTAQTGYTVTISYAGSNALAKQIIEGAPADLFLSANAEWMDQVEQAGLVQDRADILGNRLVLIGHGDAAPVRISAGTDLAGMLNGGKLAMALVDSVPAGQYGKARRGRYRRGVRSRSCGSAARRPAPSVYRCHPAHPPAPALRSSRGSSR